MPSMKILSPGLNIAAAKTFNNLIEAGG